MSSQLLRQWCASSTQISSSINSDTVILDTASGKYFSLEGVGSTLWNALKQPRSFDEILETVLDVYDVDAETASHDVSKILASLEKAGLVSAC